MSNQQSNLKYILIILILAAIVVGSISVYQRWWLSRQETKLPEITIKKEENEINKTTNWKIFTHPFYDFEIEFPYDWRGTVDDYMWLPGTIGLSSESFSFCPPHYETCSQGIAPGGPGESFAPIILFICVNGSWTSDGDCKTIEGFGDHYSADLLRPELNDAIKRVDLPLDTGRVITKIELILFDNTYEAVFDGMTSSFKVFRGE